jgi:hypothetical protein
VSPSIGVRRNTIWATRLPSSGGASAAKLEEAVTAHREALKEYTRERVPLQWATIQHSVGIILAFLGEGESGITRLEEAIAAFREALEERTRERVPLDWAVA